MSSLVEEHDSLLAEMPPGATHDQTACSVCTAKLDSPEGGVMTYSESDLIEAVQAAVAPLKAELDTLKASQADDAVAARIAEALATAQADADARITETETAAATKIDELQTQLDAAEATANTVQKQFDDLVAYLTDESETAAQAALVETRREERRAAVAELGVFTEEQIEAKLDRWVNQDDEVFADQLDDLRIIASAAKTNEEPSLVAGAPVATAVESIRTSTTPSDDRSATFSAIAELGRSGIDIRNL